MKQLLQEISQRISFMLEPWRYDKKKRNEPLWVAREEE